MSKNKNLITYIIVGFIILVIITLSFIVFKNLFSSSNSKRLDGIAEHKLSNNEINSVKDKFNELENIDDVKVYILDDKTKIIRIYIKLKEDIDFEKIKNKSNEVISCFEKSNLEFYDIEIFAESKNKDSNTYPQMGNKHKTKSEFSW